MMNEHVEITADKCKGCRRCEAACIAAHYDISLKEAMKQLNTMPSRVTVVKEGNVRVSVRCHQCLPAPCCTVCPAGALQQADDGQIIMRPRLCVACKMCIAACPYGAVSLELLVTPDEENKNPVYPTMEPVRCDMCKAWREVNGKRITACMEACPTQALYLVEQDGNIINIQPKKKAPKKEESVAE